MIISLKHAPGEIYSFPHSHLCMVQIMLAYIHAHVLHVPGIELLSIVNNFSCVLIRQKIICKKKGEVIMKLTERKKVRRKKIKEN